MNMPEKNRFELPRDLISQLIQIRRHLHEYPELSFQEYKTCQYIISCLEDWGIPYQKVGETGIMIDIIGEKGEGLHIGIRADIDALPIHEQTGLPFASKSSGVMHACGHDGHTAILLGTVHQLYRLKSELTGRIRCIFQPGEEAEGAAKCMIEQGVLDNPSLDGMLALHLWPHLPFGSVGIKYGAVTASCDDFIIEIEGRGGHCARPHQGIDAIAVSAQILHAHTILVTKGNNPVDPIVIHVGKINGGTASNAVADRVIMEGTVRTLSPETRKNVQSQLSLMIKGIAESYGATARITFAVGHPAVINDQWLTGCVEDCAKELLGPDAVCVLKEPSMGADDFGAFAERIPSAYFRLGIRREDRPCFDLHHPQFQFDDDIIPLGVKIFVYTLLTRLQKRS